MDERLQEVILETFSGVFETMFFTFLEPIEEIPTKEDLRRNGGYLEAQISYSGGHSGNFRFYFPAELARKITVNFLGVNESEVHAAQVRDTAAETANMAVGSLLGRLDPEGKCALAIPKVNELPGFAPETLLGNPDLCIFSTDFGFLMVVGRHV